MYRMFFFIAISCTRTHTLTHKSDKTIVVFFFIFFRYRRRRNVHWYSFSFHFFKLLRHIQGKFHFCVIALFKRFILFCFVLIVVPYYFIEFNRFIINILAKCIWTISECFSRLAFFGGGEFECTHHYYMEK